jgi:acyl CoA:acetate/3-ketoacid CoA transferase alpha subunit
MLVTSNPRYGKISRARFSTDPVSYETRTATGTLAQSKNILGEPSAAIHEITRQKIDHLTLVSALIATANLLIGEGLVDKMITGYARS